MVVPGLVWDRHANILVKTAHDCGPKINPLLFILFSILRWEFSVPELIWCTYRPEFRTCRTSMLLDNITDGGCRRCCSAGQRTRSRRVNKLHLLLLIAPSARTNSSNSVRRHMYKYKVHGAELESDYQLLGITSFVTGFRHCDCALFRVG